MSIDELAAFQNGAHEPPGAQRRELKPLDLAALLQAVDERQQWRVETVAADGHVTAIISPGGEGKTWLVIELARGVLAGEPSIGLACEQGAVAFFDAESGPKLFTRRIKALEVAIPGLRAFDSASYDLRSGLDVDSLASAADGCQLVVFDSLRAHTPGAEENSSTDMAAAMFGLKEIARRTGAAVVVLHHSGKDVERGGRGSTAIRDQADMVWTMGRVQGDPEAKFRRKLECSPPAGKSRLIEEPGARWFSLKSWRGTMTVQEAAPYEPQSKSRPSPKQDELAELVLAIVRTNGATSMRDLADATQRDQSDGTLRRVRDRLLKERRLGHGDDGALVLGPAATTPDGNERAPDAENALKDGESATATKPDGRTWQDGNTPMTAAVPSPEGGSEARGSLGAYDDYDPDEDAPDGADLNAWAAMSNGDGGVR
jgi:hypothetical protein